MRLPAITVLALCAALVAGAVQAQTATREQALAALEQPDPAQRFEAVRRLAEVGEMGDAHRLLAQLSDPSARVRAAANGAIWRIWERSGDEDIDRLYAQGVEQMQASKLQEALATFDTIVQRMPAFAEGWNKRATLYFLLGENERSLADCDEVLQRNPDHFGALSGAGQIHLKLGHPRQALESFERALQVNPTLEELRALLPTLREVVRRSEANTT